MAEIDSLEIKITADSDKAESSLDRIIKKLESLQSIVKNNGFENISKALSSVSTQAQNINMDKIASGMDKVSKKSDTMAKRVSKNVDEVAKKNKEAADYINSALKSLQKSPLEGGIGLRDKEGVAQLKNQLQGFYDAYLKVQNATYANKKVSEESYQQFKDLGQAAKDTAREFATIKKYVDETTQAMAEYIRTRAKSGINIGDLRSEYPGMKDYMADKKRAGKGFYSTKGESFRRVIEDMNAELDLESQGKALSPDISGFQRLVEILYEAKDEYLSFNEAKRQFESDPGEHITQIGVKLMQMANSAAAARAKIDQTAQAIRELMMQGQGIPRITDNIWRAEQAFNADIGKGGIKDIPPLLESAETRVVAIRDTFQQASDRINEATERVYEFQRAIAGASQPSLRDSRNDPIDVPYRISDPDLNFNWDMIDARAKQMEELQESADGLDFAKASASVAALGIALEKLGKTLDKLGNFGIRLLGLNDAISKIKSGISKLNLFTPLKGVVEEYKEKFDTIKEHFNDFVKKFKAGVTKMSAFWKRAMRTFTFMILRKAFTQIIKDIHEATESLALFSKEMGTTFNENISNAIADFKWIGKAIVGAFEPIINYVVPVLNVLSAALVKVITLLGHFFAALTGQGYYMVAKKKVDDYADSLKKAAKEAKKSIRPFDELNLITSGNKSDTDTGLNPAADWDMKPVSDKMKKLADKIKDIARQLFEPIKKAWDRTKDYVISGFKYMTSELGKLFKSIGRDFLKVWQQEATVKIFENIFKIVGDIERVIGNLAKRFREAWDKNDKGLHILENIRDIIGIIIDHIHNVTDYMVEWSDSIDFNPLLEGVENLTNSLKRLADFLGGVFEDVMKNVVLKYIKWLAEEGSKHFLDTIAEIIDAFNFDKIRQDLVPVEEAFEKLLENIHTGVTNAIGVLGKALADWMNSENFTKFMESLAHIMQQITAERVEKVLEALGLAILQIAEAVANFVSSEGFLKFIDKIGEWIDSKSAEDLAGYVKGIIELTAAFKGLGLILPIVGKGLVALAAVKFAGNITKIANALSGANATAGGLIPGFNAAGGVEVGGGAAASGTAAGATFAAAFIAAVGAAVGGWNFGQWLDKKLNGDEGMGSFKEQMKGIKDSFTDGSWKDALDLWGQDIASAWSEIGSGIAEKWNSFWDESKRQRQGALNDLSEQLSETKENTKANWEGIKNDVTQSLQTTRQNVTQDWSAIGTEIKTKLGNIKTDVSTNFSQFKADATTKLGELKTSVQTKMSEVKTSFDTTLSNIKAKFANFSLFSFGAKIINSLLSGLRSAWQSVSTFLNNKVQEIKSKFNFNFSFGASGGGVRHYATGGFPEDGWFRASHGEMIGEFDNGQSVVANNQQIIDGIKAGVIDGMMQIMPSLAQAVGGDTNVVIEGDMSKMFRAMVKENYGANKRTFNASPLYS